MRLASFASRTRTAVRDVAPPVVLLLLLAACGPAATATSSLGAPATASATTTAIPSPGGSPLATVPTGLPVMPGSEPVAPLPNDPQLLARWTSAADGAQVYDFFVEALPDAGFQVDQLAPGGEAAIITFSTPDRSQLVLSLTARGAGTRIDLRLPDAAAD
jgi:hypothetical protein